MAKFPKDPTPGQLYQVKPGLYYKYDADLALWVKQDTQSALATPLSAGLMSADDYTKLSKLVIPPPTTSITIAGLSTTLASGEYVMVSGDEYLAVEGESRLVNVADTYSRKLYQHTHSFDFSIDTNVFFQYLVSSGKLVVRSPKGVTGPIGYAGPNGTDSLPYGPDGPQGDAGKNAPFNINLASEPIDFQRNQQSARAIVAIETEEVSAEENYLVVKRANVGNPDACPSEIRLNSDIQSSWVVAAPLSTSISNFSWSDDPACLRCTSSLYYLDISPILDAIKTEFESEVASIKQDCQQAVAFWLSVMSGVFDQQKSSLCCALEYCKSQQRNADTRRYLEQQRIQAAQTQVVTSSTTNESGETTYNVTGHSLVIDGDPFNSGTSVVSNSAMTIHGEIGTNTGYGTPSNADAVGGSHCVPGIVIIDGQTIKYDDCPPGFIPRQYARQRYQGVDLVGETRTYSADYDPSAKPTGYAEPSSGPTVARYSPYGGAVAGYGVDARRSNNSSTSTSLQVVVTGAAELISDVKVVVGSKDGLQKYVAGLTESNGKVTFHNLSTSDDYLIALSKAGVKFTPDKFTNVLFTAGAVTSLTAVAAVDPTTALPSTATEVKIGSGSHSLNVTVAGDTDAFARVYRYDDGLYLGGSSVSPSGNVRFKGFGYGKYVCRVTSTTGTVDLDCGPHPVSVFPGVSVPTRNLKLIRDCPSFYFLRSDGDSQVSAITFKVTPTVTTSSVRPKFVPPDSPEYFRLLDVELRENPVPELEDGGDITFVVRRGRPEISYAVNAITGSMGHVDLRDITKDTVGFSVKWSRGVYYLLIHGSGALQVQGNARFSGGFGEGWSDEFIGDDGKLVVFVKPGPWWLQIAVDGGNLLAEKLVELNSKRVEEDLPAGKYIVDIIKCCVKVGTQYTGHIALYYNDETGQAIKRFPNFGAFSDPDMAVAAYRGSSQVIDHAGGLIALELGAQALSTPEGSIVVRFVPSGAVPVDNMRPLASTAECFVQVGYIRWYESVWTNKQCYGAIVRVMGQDFIVVGRPDLQPCAEFPQAAIAWPTLDKSTFAPIPATGAVGFKRNAVLESEIIKIIKSGRCLDVVGNPQNFTTVIVPVTD